MSDCPRLAVVLVAELVEASDRPATAGVAPGGTMPVGGHCLAVEETRRTHASYAGRTGQRGARARGSGPRPHWPGLLRARRVRVPARVVRGLRDQPGKHNARRITDESKES